MNPQGPGNRNGSHTTPITAPDPAGPDWLDPDALVAEARLATGLENLGDRSAMEALGHLVHALTTEIHLSAFGRERLKRFIADKLAVRLRLIDAHERNSDLRREAIVSPVFIVGLPRTGSTLLHHLFSVDRRNRLPLRWEMLQPFPPPETATYRTDPRISRENEALRPMLDAAPDIAAMHPMRADFPEECMHILTGAFASSVFTALTGSIGYDRAMRTWDMEPAYGFHRQYLQLLQWKCPGSPWVLKSPMHTGHIAAIDAVYPDARFIWLHRDPEQVLASWCLLTITMQGRHVDGVDVRSAAQDKIEEWAWHVRAGHAARQAIGDERRFADVAFEDLVAEPVATMERLHEWLGLEVTDRLTAAMQRYVDHPPYPRGGYSKDASPYHLDTRTIEQAFEDYNATYR